MRLILPQSTTESGEAATVAHGASVEGLVFVCEAVGDALHGSVLVPVGIVKSLDEASGGCVILRHRHLEQSGVWQRPGGLHQTLAEAAGPDEHAAVEILDRTRHNLR